jgi:hypothetical protein
MEVGVISEPHLERNIKQTHLCLNHELSGSTNTALINVGHYCAPCGTFEEAAKIRRVHMNVPCHPFKINHAVIVLIQQSANGIDTPLIIGPTYGSNPISREFLRLSLSGKFPEN